MGAKSKQYFNIFVFIISLIFFDQLSKYLVVKYVKLGSIYFSFFENFFRIIHVRNTGILFSMGSNIHYSLKKIFFLIMPIFILIFVFYLSLKEKNCIARISLLLIFSGGAGNVVDRLFRPSGVVDFLDFKFYGIFGLDRWPTFNFADSYVVIGMILFLVNDFFIKRKALNT
ncbi:signal peptidase II [Borrelia sp. CA_690]|uniref:Lipoprotein signal peptidase n=1 Tax=Borrelia maritima TaxID=2761123 RepID=A0A5J6WD33_9SPIR|nr:MULTISPECIES: signal peptidase II [Borrelia]QFI14587.1 signal peptidase II [Borrelia maritima]WKC84443.1 signal peptidase II [Borrelia sp. CA_690]